MIENISQLKDFLASRGEGTTGHQYWIVSGSVVSSKLAGPQGYIPEGFFEFQVDSFESLEAYVSEKQEGSDVAFQVVNLDVNALTPNTLVLNAIRWQSFPEHAAMLVCSSSGERIVEAREELQNSDAIQTQALFLVDMSTIVT